MPSSTKYSSPTPRIFRLKRLARLLRQKTVSMWLRWRVGYVRKPTRVSWFSSVTWSRTNARRFFIFAKILAHLSSRRQPVGCVRHFSRSPSMTPTECCRPARPARSCGSADCQVAGFGAISTACLKFPSGRFVAMACRDSRGNRMSSVVASTGCCPRLGKLNSSMMRSTTWRLRTVERQGLMSC